MLSNGVKLVVRFVELTARTVANAGSRLLYFLRRN